MRDDLLAEQDRNNKFVERYKDKVEKQERMATLSIPTTYSDIAFEDIIQLMDTMSIIIR